jgi:hypothetical protein
LKNARCFFECHADSYKDGKFQWTRGKKGGQEDWSDSLVLRENAPCMRVYLEAEGDGDDDDDDDDNCESGTAAGAINAIHVCGTQAGEQPAPLLREGYNGLNSHCNRVKETTTPERVFFLTARRCWRRRRGEKEEGSCSHGCPLGRR